METNTILAFLKKASEDEGLRKELVALAGRYGVQLGSDELSEAALDQVAGGLWQGFDLSTPKLQTSLKSSLLGGQRDDKIIDVKGFVGNVAKLGDGSV
ncbi:MAG: hypothetical protein IPJ48_21105 [Propionivibrio sp.]|uniref:Nif11 domain-containing protein n=1 Tax=Candidatus Propionivibrio dominans TaxID=2954373 RepID=A0A9D7IAN5_9RHOO|nr:hypothetical protein [Candidatus Propionivibrio dominans]MBL0167219.1 hypothetical protein [Propionivibrio sp.]